MPARRNQDKTCATETPLVATEDAFARETAANATDPEDTETVETAPSLTLPAPRRSVRKAGTRRPAAGVPRTIAELERQEAGLPLDNGSDSNDDTADVTTGTGDDEAPPDAEDDAPVAEAEQARPILRVPLRVVGIITAAMWLLAAFVPQVVLITAQRVGVTTGTSAAVYYAALGIGAALALALLFRAWRGAFGTAPDDLRWRTVRAALAREIPTAPGGPMRRNTWRTASLAALFGGVFMVVVSAASAVLNPTASNFFLLLGFFVTLFAKATTAVVFVGFLQRALAARFPKPRAALLSGAAYGVASAVLLAAGVAVPIQAANGISVTAAQVIEELAFSATVGFFICIGIAWFRMKANSVWAAVAFLLTLWILLLPLGILL